MKNTPKAPEGYRELGRGEVIKDGDIRIVCSEIVRHGVDEGNKYDPENHWNGRYRKIEEKVTVKSMTIQECYVEMQSNCGISKGDTVKVLRTARENELGWGTAWVPSMNDLVGKSFVVNNVNPKRGFLLFHGSSYYWLPFFVLELISKKPTTISVVLNNSHTAECSKEGIKVGCQNFKWDIIEKLSEAKKQLDK
jgi:hypothetical protein